MKFILSTFAFVLATTAAYAHPTVVSTLARVNTAMQQVQGVQTGLNAPAILGRINSSATMAVGSTFRPAQGLEAKLESITVAIESVASSNDDNFNGLSKAARLQALLLVYVTTINNNGANAELNSLLSGQLYTRAVSPVDSNEGVITMAQFQKYIDVLEVASEGREDLDVASQRITGGSLAEFARNCGQVTNVSQGAPNRR